MNTDPRPEDSKPSSENETPQPEAAAPPPEPSPVPPPAPPPESESPATTTSDLSKDSLNMGMLCHLLAFAGLIVPFGTIIGPLILWLVKKDQDPYVDEQGKEVVNFQISMAIYTIVSIILIFAVIGALLLPIVLLANLILTIIGAVKASKGEPWQYPVTIRMVK